MSKAVPGFEPWEYAQSGRQGLVLAERAWLGQSTHCNFKLSKRLDELTSSSLVCGKGGKPYSLNPNGQVATISSHTPEGGI
jgi:hypothetical protein